MPRGAADCSLLWQSECSGACLATPCPCSRCCARRGLAHRVLPQAPPLSSLGPTSPSTPVWQQQAILMLKEQNRLLTQVRCGRWGWGWRPSRP